MQASPNTVHLHIAHLYELTSGQIHPTPLWTLETPKTSITT